MLRRAAVTLQSCLLPWPPAATRLLKPKISPWSCSSVRTGFRRLSWLAFASFLRAIALIPKSLWYLSCAPRVTTSIFRYWLAFKTKAESAIGYAITIKTLVRRPALRLAPKQKRFRRLLVSSGTAAPTEPPIRTPTALKRRPKRCCAVVSRTPHGTRTVVSAHSASTVHVTRVSFALQ